MTPFTKKTGLKILLVGAEAAPYVKIGGLGEVMRSLPRALRDLGHDARVMFPKYAGIDTKNLNLQPEILSIPLFSSPADPHGLLVSNVLKLIEPDGRITAYLLENAEYYEKRANVYGYKDDTARWVLLSKGVLEFIKQSEWKPDIIVANDWMTGFIPNLLETEYKNDPILSKIATVFIIHNLKHQGMFDQRFISEIDYDSGQGPIPDFFDPNLWKLNGMRRGILYADIISTVSPTYAQEILSPEFGEKLEEILRSRRSRLFGVLNGIDYEESNPETDPKIAFHFNASGLKERLGNKTVLQKKVNLPEDTRKFVVGFVGRLDEQKGISLLMPVIDSLLENLGFQLVLVGTGEDNFRVFFQELQNRHPQQVSVNLMFDADIPKMIFAGADIVLIPSKFEPCGLVQMEAMRYGAIPLVRRVGGLADSVVNYSPEENKGTGFMFDKYDQNAFLITLVRAFETFRFKKEWDKLIKRAMVQDFSWRQSAKEYAKLFQKALTFHQEQQK